MKGKACLRRTPQRPRRGGVLLALLCLAAGGCGAGGEDEAATTPRPEDSHLARIRERGTLRQICFPHQENVFVRVNVAKGPMPRVGTSEDFLGIDVDILEAFARSLGVELEIHPVTEPSYGALIPDLLADKGDVIASSFSITGERQKQVDYSRPYYTVYRQVVVPRGSPIVSAEDLAGAVAATISGSSQEEYLRSLGHERFHYVAFTLENYTAVAEGHADFTLVDSTISDFIVREVEGLEIAFRFPEEDHYGMAVPPGSDLLEPLNGFLTELDESGELEEIIDRHMAARAAE